MFYKYSGYSYATEMQLKIKSEGESGPAAGYPMRRNVLVLAGVSAHVKLATRSQKVEIMGASSNKKTK